MKHLKLLLIAVFGFVLFALPSLASADVNNFTVTNFTADETLSRADPQGQLRVIEHINVNFTDYNHGILRAIPASYKGHSLQLHVNNVTSKSGAPSQYTTYGSSGNTVLKVGDPAQTVTGPQEYTIDYTLRNVISFYKDHDELYWDVNGDQWQQPFDVVSVRLHLPSGLQPDRQTVCYTGSFGSTSHNCAVTNSASLNGTNVAVSTTQPLSPQQTLTFVVGFKKGYFQPAKWYETASERLKPILEFGLPVLFIGGGSLLYWLRRGRDPKGRGTIIPQYDAPDELKPLAVDGLLKFQADNNGITATIIDLAIRGYIRIVETTEHRTLRKDTQRYSLQLVKTDYTQLDAHESILMKALFSDTTAGATVDFGAIASNAALRTNLYTAAKTLKTDVNKELTTAGYLRNNPGTTQMTIIIGVLVFIVFFLWHVVGTPFALGCLVAGAIAVLCLINMAARTAKGVAAKEHVLGLKLYLEVAEKDRLEKLQGPNAAYAAQTSEPVKTVDLFEKLLPYAMVLGVEKQWARQFEGLYTSPPSWYSGGNWTAFNAYYLASSLNQGIGAAVNSAFSAPSSSGGSGFGGGGFAGGGGGGGGGGGW